MDTSSKQTPQATVLEEGVRPAGDFQLVLLDYHLKIAYVNRSPIVEKDIRRRAAYYHAHNLGAPPMADPRPCMMPQCWVETLGDQCFCTLHEMHYVAEYGRPSPKLASKGDYVDRIQHRMDWARKLVGAGDVKDSVSKLVSKGGNSGGFTY